MQGITIFSLIPIGISYTIPRAGCLIPLPSVNMPSDATSISNLNALANAIDIYVLATPQLTKALIFMLSIDTLVYAAVVLTTSSSMTP